MPTDPLILYGEVNFIIRNQVDDIVLMHGICHVSKGEKDGDFSIKILPKSEASVKVKVVHMIAGRVECCLVYELINQRNESEPVMESHQVFIAVRVFAKPFTNSYEASAAMFMAKMDRFTSKKDSMKWLKERILQKHPVNNTYSFECAIKDRMLRLEATFHPGKRAIIEATLEETIKYTNRTPILFG
jgi:hypothetical protein